MEESPDYIAEKTGDTYTYDEAVELAGHGRYNYLLLIGCSIIANAFALDMFGFATVVAASSCDLKTGMQEIGILASAPFAGVLFAFPWGYYADTRGRRRALLLSTTVGFFFAVVSSLAPSWQFMLAIKLIGSSFSTASFTISLTVLGECTVARHRSQFLLIMNSFNMASEVVAFCKYCYTCNDVISPNTLYSGMVCGLLFFLLNLSIVKIASYPRLILITTLIVAGISSTLVNLKEPVANLVFFFLVQCTALGVGCVATYFVDLYPTCHRGLVTSLGMMVARLVSFMGVNVIGIVITSYCELTFYCLALLVLSGVVVSLFLPSDGKSVK